MAQVSLRTIGGRFIIMSVVFILIIIALTILTIFQNRNSELALHVIQEVRIPVRLISGNIVGSLDRVMSQQRAYMLSGDAVFKSERTSVYTNEIYPGMRQLELLAQELPQTQRQIIEEIAQKVKRFEDVQNSILSYFEQYMLPYMQAISSADETDWDKLSSAFIGKRRGEQAIAERIKEADAIRAELLLQIIEIRNSQEAMLGAGIGGIVKNLSRAQLVLTVLSGVIFLFLFMFTVLNIKSLKNSIKKPVALINILATGALPETIEESTDELNEILEAGKALTININKASQFATAIGEGRLDEPFQEAGENDILGKSLLHMRDRLRLVAQEEQKRNWTTTGMADLGNILRNTTYKTDELYLQLLSYLIKYNKANQGALYLVETVNDEGVLNMVACYAYGKKKYLSQQIYPGQGLVGQLYYEKEPIYLKEIPSSYIRITSGLGEAPPKAIFICPLMLHEDILGVIEMASFNDFEPYHQEFIKQACEQIASVIASVKNNERTANLLHESQQQTEELRAQEEEMRQNMEALTATQEELARKEKEYLNKISLLEHTLVER